MGSIKLGKTIGIALKTHSGGSEAARRMESDFSIGDGLLLNESTVLANMYINIVNRYSEAAIHFFDKESIERKKVKALALSSDSNAKFGNSQDYV